MKLRFTPIMALFGFAFLYGPILSLIIFSFNKSKLVTVWGGWSTKWYAELFANEQIMNAAWLSLKIGVISASVATVFGTMMAMVLVRFKKVRGRGIMGGMITGPLVMPDVIIGLSLLLLFVSMQSLIGWPAGRGLTTILIAHITFNMAFVTVVVQSRLSDMDDSIEEAALDLGASPTRVFFDITLPMITPALISGWLLAFTLSLDDLVISSFVSGPGATTLPMVIFSKVRLGVSPDINALASLIVLVVSIGIVISAILMRKKRK
ncbi:MAG TPA: ABC transporter permease subunit [Rhodobacteraceae bacterium]|nr:ABC transporter permease subunit [Paracoccaceae bacterium]